MDKTFCFKFREVTTSDGIQKIILQVQLIYHFIRVHNTIGTKNILMLIFFKEKF